MVSLLPATSAHAGMQTHSSMHIRLMQSCSKFPALRANWLKLAERDETKSKVKAEEGGKKRRRERTARGNTRVHKPTGFRWISSQEEIFHSQKLLHWVLKLSGKIKQALLSIFIPIY